MDGPSVKKRQSLFKYFCINCCAAQSPSAGILFKKIPTIKRVMIQNLNGQNKSYRQKMSIFSIYLGNIVVLFKFRLKTEPHFCPFLLQKNSSWRKKVLICFGSLNRF